jgi:hypothetical protein
LLTSVQARIGDAELKKMAAKAVREVRRQEQTHVNWNEQTLTKLAMEAAGESRDRDFEETEATQRAAMSDRWKD